MRAPNSSEIAIVLGFILLGYGLWMLEPWISLAVTGATLIVYGVAADILGAILRNPTRKRK